MGRLTVILAILLWQLTVLAQTDSVASGGPKVTPVDMDEQRTTPLLHYYDRHGNPLSTPVLVLEEDTVPQGTAKPIYPHYNGTALGLNFGDAIFMAFGQRYASFDAWASVSLFNWIFPTVEAGIGMARENDAKHNFRYRTPAAPYVKIGLDYNFLYKSDPAYKLLLGLRAGWSHFNYEITNVNISSGYWDETQVLSLGKTSCTSWYGEALLGLQVKIAGGFSLGWTARWHFPFHTQSKGGGKPWFIPGYGGDGAFGFSVSAIWNFQRRSKPKTNEENNDIREQ